MSFNEKYKIFKFPFMGNKLYNTISVIMIITIMFLLFFPIYIYLSHLQYKIKSEVVKWSIVALYFLNLIILGGFSAYYIYLKFNPPEKPDIVKQTRVGEIKPRLGQQPNISQPQISGLSPATESPAESPAESSAESPTESPADLTKPRSTSTPGPFG